MKTKLPIFLVFLFSTSFLYAQQFEKSSSKELIPQVKCFSSGKIEDFHIPARNITKSSKEPTAVFEITYTGFSDEAKAAFQAAADIWSTLISSPVPITIDARWESMETGVLGSSGPPEVFKNFKNATFKDTWYVPTIANRLSGYDLNPDDYDMITRYNSDYSWYLGTDGDGPMDQTDFITVVLHEIGHSLGFSSNAYRDGINGGIGYYTNDGGMAGAFDHFMYNGGDSLLMDSTLFENPSSELFTEFTSGEVYFDSPLSNAANGDTATILYAPSSWSGGSSISHLGEIYNGTENALMTYSVGTRESLHHPGPITMGLFAEVGWVSVRFEHDHLKDIESMSNPTTVNVEMYSDSSIISGSVYLHYSTDNFATDNKVSMTTLNDTLFTYDIPTLVADTVRYYIEAKTSLDRNYFYPSQGEGSINATFADSSLYFIIGEDNKNPELIYDQKIDYILDFEEIFEIEVEADDNFGIDSVLVEYKINDNTAKSIKIPYINENPIGLPKYGIDLPLSEETLNDLDTLYFRFIAVDVSSNANNTTLPESGYYKVVIHEIYPTETDAIVNFDETNDENIFIFNGLSIDQPANFDSKALHSPHPYEAGEDYGKSELIYTATLKTPIILSDTAEISFKEVVIVEIGEPGTSYGDSDFWDYVIIEGSKDTGKTWHDFTDGYDCSIDPSFVTAYNSNGVGSESMYLWHTISLLENENLVVGDEVLVRFKLWSDPGAVGWGWAIDDVYIQATPNLTSTNNIVDNAKNLKLYPNPATGYFNMEFNSREIMNELNISIYSIDGKLVYSEDKLINDKFINEQIDVKNMNTGIYIIKLNTGKDIITERLLIK